MKLLFLAFFVGVACGAKMFHENIKEFEKEFGVWIPGKELEKKAAKILKKVEEEINENNKKFDEGKSTFQEKLYPESVLSKDEFEKIKEGLIMPSQDEIPTARFIRNGHHGKGLILPDDSVRYGPENVAKLAEMDAELERASVPASFNAVKKGWVTQPKDQGNCGSCVAFAAQGLHEACMIKAGAKLTGMDLSEQYLVDCGFNGDSMNGCNGAHPNAYTKWFASNKGESPHESDYKYLGKKGACKTVAKYSAGAKVVSYKSAENMADGETRIMKAVAAKGAVTVGVYAADSKFDNYAKGIFQGCSSKKANHAVLVVGYGTEKGVKYWLVKNSWGKNWGEGGYFRIKRGSNECGIESNAMVYATCEATSGTGTTASTTAAATTAAATTTAATTAAATTAAATTAAPANLTCDLTYILGPGETGSGTLEIFTPNGLIIADISCVNSICTPINPAGVTNACIYMCGELTC